MDGMAPAVGIDLGTTYSCVGVWLQQHNRVEIVANDQGHRVTPSCVSFTDSERLFGDAALDRAATNPANTIFAVKRLIGQRFSDPSVQDSIKLWPFSVIRGPNDKPSIVVKYKGEEKQFCAEEISSMIIAKMKEIAETYLGCTVKNAVITVPAYFNDSQRRSTMDAGAIAGLNVMRIMDEPTAAAVAYGFDKIESNFCRKHVLVFDLGGGTFDVSLLSMNRDAIEVKATAGDTQLGGEDFDNRMMKYFIEEFKRKHNKDVSEDSKALRRLRNACERAKRTLSFQNQTTLQVDCLYEGIDFVSRISQARFDELNMDLFQRCMDLVENCIKDAKIGKDRIDVVLLVGGSTRIPKVQNMLQQYFEGKVISKGINPDEAVAYGATIQAAKLSGQGSKEIQDLVLIDVSPLSLGVELTRGRMHVVVPRNTPIPTKKKSKLTTAHDDQTKLRFSVYEGERPEVKHNNLLGEFTLRGIPPAPRHAETIDVCFEIDANGILTVTAQIRDSGSKKSITITNENGRLGTEEIERMIKDAEWFKTEDEEFKKKYEAYNSLEKFVYDLKNRIKDAKIANDEIPETIEEAIERADLVVNQNPLPQVTDSVFMLNELEANYGTWFRSRRLFA